MFSGDSPHHQVGLRQILTILNGRLAHASVGTQSRYRHVLVLEPAGMLLVTSGIKEIAVFCR